MVIPSRHEAMSIVVLEAGICGTPVLITDQCGFDDVALQEGGMVVEATVEGLQKGLLAMTSNPARLNIMGQNLKKYTQDLFLWNHIIKRHLELFAEKGGTAPPFYIFSLRNGCNADMRNSGIFQGGQYA